MTEHIEANGVRLAFHLEGPRDAPVVVFMNSLGTTMDLFDAEATQLAGTHRVLRYDLRGHGGSGCPAGPYTLADLGGDLVALLDELEIRRAHLVGLSIGGMIALWVAAHHPTRVDRLVVACAAPALPPARAWHDRAAAVRAQGVAPLTESLFGRWFTAAVRAERPEVPARVAAMLAGCDAEGYAACCEAIATTDLRDDLVRIDAPTLVLAGREDPVVPPTTALALSEALSDASLVVLANTAHLANLNAPEHFAAALAGHLGASAAARGMAVRKEVLGEAHVAHAGARTGRFGAPFQDFITRYAWGEIWGRPGLDRRTRSAVTLAVLTALGRVEELSFHVPAARRNGLSVSEIQEILLHCAVYAGVPAANSAFAAAAAALDKDAHEHG